MQCHHKVTGSDLRSNMRQQGPHRYWMQAYSARAGQGFQNINPKPLNPRTHHHPPAGDPWRQSSPPKAASARRGWAPAGQHGTHTPGTQASGAEEVRGRTGLWDSQVLPQEYRLRLCRHGSTAPRSLLTAVRRTRRGEVCECSR